MRYLFSCMLISLLTVGLMTSEAQAKRFGGGRSFGVQRPQSSLFKQNTAQKRPLAAGQRNNTSKWGGVLGGLLMGGLLASLLMGHGLGTGIITWLLLGAAILFLVSFFRRKMHPGMQSAGPATLNTNNFNHFTNSDLSSSNNDFEEYPLHFNPEQFLRQAKVMFIRLQKAYDEKNLPDLSDFTAPEVFAEIRIQLDERGDIPNVTEIITLDTELLDVSTQARSVMASVRFTGSLKENDDAQIELDEVWHFRQFEEKGAWVVGGIQQGV